MSTCPAAGFWFRPLLKSTGERSPALDTTASSVWLTKLTKGTNQNHTMLFSSLTLPSTLVSMNVLPDPVGALSRQGGGWLCNNLSVIPSISPCWNASGTRVNPCGVLTLSDREVIGLPPRPVLQRLQYPADAPFGPSAERLPANKL